MSTEYKFRAVRDFRDWFPQVWISRLTSSGAPVGWCTLRQFGPFRDPETAIYTAMRKWEP